MPASVLLWILVASIFVIPVVLRLAIGDDDPDNAVTQVQEGGPRSDPDDLLAVAAEPPEPAPERALSHPELGSGYRGKMSPGFWVQEACGPYAQP